MAKQEVERWGRMSYGSLRCLSGDVQLWPCPQLWRIQLFSRAHKGLAERDKCWQNTRTLVQNVHLMAAAWQNIFVTRVKQHNESSRSSLSSVGKRNKYKQVVVVVLLSDSRLRSLSKSHKTPLTGICKGELLHKLLIIKHDVIHISNSVPWTNINRKESWCHLALTKPYNLSQSFWLLTIFTPEVIQKHHYMWFWTSEKSLHVLLCVYHYGTFYFNLRSQP